MSIVAGFTFPDGAILVADGMVAEFRNGNPEPHDLYPDVNKLQRVSETIYAARFGVESVAEEIITRIRRAQVRREGDFTNPDKLRDRLREATAEVWESEERGAATPSGR